MPLRLAFYGGVGEIGGNKILLEEGDVRLWLDFGTPFGRHKQYFNEYLNPRAARGLWDLLALRLLPPLPSLYREDLAVPGMWERFADNAADPGPPSAVLLSHAHLDHLGDVAFLRPDVPIIASPEAAVIARAMQVSGLAGASQEWCFCTERVWNDDRQVLETPRHAAYRGRPFFLLSESVPDGLRSWWQESPSERKLLEAPAPQPFAGRVGSLRVRWWPVDHSIPGAVAFAVETAAGWVAYTGDIRFHGHGREAGERLKEAWATMGIEVLLCEGTRLGEGSARTVSEMEVAENALALTREAAGRLVVADFAARNLERLATFLGVARETDRLLAVQPRDAYLLEALALVSEAFREVVADERLVVYDDVKSRPRAWERGVRERWQPRLVGPEAVARDPGGYILCCSLWDLNDLLDLPPESVQGGVYLYANSRAYDEEQAVDLERLRQWVRHLGLRMEGDPDDPEAVPLHASGHASEADLVEFVRGVRPRVLVPVHTERPERWRELLQGTGIEVRPPGPAGARLEW